MTLLAPPAPAARPVARWVPMCAIDDLEPERGHAALLGDVQMALFLLDSGRVHAVSHRDPYSGAHVMARGIVGDRGGVPAVASPMYKQVFDLRTGVCLDTQGKDGRSLQTWPVAVRSGEVLVRWEGGR